MCTELASFRGLQHRVIALALLSNQKEPLTENPPQPKVVNLTLGIACESFGKQNYQENRFRGTVFETFFFVVAVASPDRAAELAAVSRKDFKF